MSAPGLRRVTAAGRLAALAALAIILIAALPAAAQARAFTSTGDDLGLTVPGDHSAGDQYVETLPTIGGPRAPRKSKHAKKLPKRVAKKLRQYGGSDAGTLEQLAGSTALGAPQAEGGSEGQRSDASANGKGSKQGRARKHKRGGGSAPAVPSAAISAADRGEAGLEWLAIAILAITALSLGAVGYQRHRHKDSTGQ